jgi:hypothetical protein
LARGRFPLGEESSDTGALGAAATRASGEPACSTVSTGGVFVDWNHLDASVPRSERGVARRDRRLEEWTFVIPGSPRFRSAKIELCGAVSFYDDDVLMRPVGRKVCRRSSDCIGRDRSGRVTAFLERSGVCQASRLLSSLRLKRGAFFLDVEEHVPMLVGRRDRPHTRRRTDTTALWLG